MTHESGVDFNATVEFKRVLNTARAPVSSFPRRRFGNGGVGNAEVIPDTFLTCRETLSSPPAVS